MVKSGHLKRNPIENIDAPKQTRKILPSLSDSQVNYLIDVADNLRDRAIIGLLADSGMRLSEIASIKASEIDWEDMTITIIGKGNRQRKAPFNGRSGKLLRQYLNQSASNGNIWSMKPRSIQCMLRRLSIRMGIPFSTHSFRRGFACNLHRKGLSTLSIMHLGGWSGLEMVERYTRSITFEDCLKHYRRVTEAGS